MREGAASETGRLAPGTLSALIGEIARTLPDGGDEAWSADLRAGQRIGEFELVRELGRGGFGVVWEARDGEGRRVAFKAVRPGPRARLREERLLREAEATARLSHPNLVELLHAGHSEDGPYLVMELLAGRTVADRLREGPLPVEEALRVGLEVARALAHAHAEGVVHRDLKPENVMLCEDGRVKLLDLGLAHAFGRRRVEGGTAGYMAPEQAAGAPEDERTDVFALGVLLFEMLSGERPRPSGWLAGAPRLEIHGAPALGAAVTSALSQAPVARPRDAGELLPVLEALQARLAARPLAPGAVRVRRGRWRRSAVAAVASAAVAALVAALLVHAGVSRVKRAGPSASESPLAVADFANETGERELENLSGLLVTSLEESRRFPVLPRSRMRDVLRQLGHPEVGRIDEALGREAAREAGARALLVGTVRKLGGRYVVDVRALDPVRGEPLFEVRERAANADGLFDLVDRLGEATHRHFLDGGGGPAPRPVAAITTKHVKAWDHLARARQAFDRNQIELMRAELDAALAEDPEFALARQQLALASLWTGRGEIHGSWPRYLGRPRDEDDERNVAAAARIADRLPDKERLTLMAAIAWEEDRYMESLRLRDQLAEAFPLDKEAIFYAGDARWHLAETGESIPYFERVLQLDPEHAVSLYHLASAAALSGRAREYLPWARRVLAAVTSPGVNGFVAQVFLAAGEEDEALDALRRTADARTLPPLYRVFRGQADEAEADLRRAPEARAGDSPELVFWRLELGLTLAAQGRLLAARQELGATRDGRLPGGDALLELLFAAAAQDPDALGAATRTAEERGVFEDPGLVGEALVALATGSDAAAATRLAVQVRRAPTFGELPPADRGIVGGLAAWGTGDLAAAREELLGTARRSDVYVRYLGLVLLGSLALEHGDAAGAVAALEEARALPWTPAMDNRVWKHPALLHALARGHELTGDLARARERNDELLRLWRRADPDLPLLAEARALSLRLAAAR